MPAKSLISPLAPSASPRMVGRHSDKISQSLEDSEKQLRGAEQKRVRKGQVRLEAASRGQIASPSDAEFLAAIEQLDELTMTEIYADEELRGDPEAETNHMRADQ